jgi:hypothetical protein
MTVLSPSKLAIASMMVLSLSFNVYSTADSIVGHNKNTLLLNSMTVLSPSTSAIASILVLSLSLMLTALLTLSWDKTKMLGY